MGKYTEEYCRKNKVAIKVNSRKHWEKLASIFGTIFRFEKGCCYKFTTNGVGYNDDNGYYEEHGVEVIKFETFIQDNEEIRKRIFKH